MNLEQEIARHTPRRPTLLTIGVFDGVHLGHRHLLGHLTARAKEKGCQAGLVTFKTHPEKVLNRRDTIPWITTLQERVHLLKDAGIKVVVPITFTREVSNLTAREFILLLRKHLKLCDLVLGPDFALGKHRQGDTVYLQKLGEELDFRVEVVKPAKMEGEIISSSIIRRLLAEGDIDKVNRMLGRHFSLDGRVVVGDRRGRILGFPTANLKVQPEQAMPKDGIYASIAHFKDSALPAVTNIGIRPTFDGHKRLIETFIFDFNEDIYGKKLRIDLVARMRDEMKFNNVEELKKQMKLDSELARRTIASLRGTE